MGALSGPLLHADVLISLDIPDGRDGCCIYAVLSSIDQRICSAVLRLQGDA